MYIIQVVLVVVPSKKIDESLRKVIFRLLMKNARPNLIMSRLLEPARSYWSGELLISYLILSYQNVNKDNAII